MSTRSFGPVEDVLHGVTVLDPYRWLEDRDLPETEQWIQEQKRLGDEYFARLPEFDRLRERVHEYLDVEVVDQPTRVKDRYFYRKRARGQEQASIYMREVATSDEQLLVDPSQRGPFVSVHIYRISTDASLLAYGVRHGGEDKKSISILHIPTGALFPDQLEIGYARGLVFTPANDGFYYCHETGNFAVDHQIRLHRFGHPLTEDTVIFRTLRTPESRLTVTADGTRLGAIWLHLGESETVADFSIATISENLVWKPVFVDKKLPYTPILCRGMILALVQSDSGSSKIIELAEDGRPGKTIVPDQLIRQITITRSGIYANYFEDCVFSIHGWSFAGENLGEIDLPADGTIQLFGNQTQDEDGFFYSHESFSQPPSIREYKCSTETSKLWQRQLSPAREEIFEIRNAFYPSKDGTTIPLTLVSLEARALGGPAAVLMTSYGGFGVPMTPQYSVLVTIMMEFGAVFALPRIRGGGEFGNPWHEAGRAHNRQNAFDDFLCAGEWLCAEGITALKRIGIFGGSNSGLLVAAAMTQRPDIFGAVLCMAPLLDMVRYESFDQAIKWRGEFGTVNNAEDFRALYAYSPYHHVEDDVQFPPVMFVSGDKDDRCNPAHVRKMAALLQNRDSWRPTVIVDYCEQRGHSPALPLSERADALARRIAFLSNELNLRINV